MLKYTKIINDTVYSKPYNLAYLESDSPNIAIYVNDRLQEIVGPNASESGIRYTIKKYYPNSDLFASLVYSGTKASHGIELDKTIYSDMNVVYLRNSFNDLWLNIDDDTPIWSDKHNRSKFFLDPFFFGSEYLWKKVFGSIPKDANIENLWYTPKEIELFNRTVIDVYNLPSLVEPLKFEVTDANLEFVYESVYVSHDIEIKAKDGDKIKLVTDKDRLEFTFVNKDASRMLVPNISGSHTTRPMISIPIKTLNPNSEWTYAVILEKGENLFVISITERDKVFHKSMRIFRD